MQTGTVRMSSRKGKTLRNLRNKGETIERCKYIKREKCPYQMKCPYRHWEDGQSKPHNKLKSKPGNEPETKPRKEHSRLRVKQDQTQGDQMVVPMGGKIVMAGTTARAPTSAPIAVGPAAAPFAVSSSSSSSLSSSSALVPSAISTAPVSSTSSSSSITSSIKSSISQATIASLLSRNDSHRLSRDMSKSRCITLKEEDLEKLRLKKKP